MCVAWDCVRLCVLKLFQSNRRRPEREVACDLTTRLLTDVEVDQVLSSTLCYYWSVSRKLSPLSTY